MHLSCEDQVSQGNRPVRLSAAQMAAFVAGLESIGLRRDLILDGMERGLQALRDEQDAKPN